MPLGRFLTHRVTIVRRLLDEETLDEYGQPTETEIELATDVAVAITPRKAIEQDLTSQSGAAISDHLIYLYPRDIRTSDLIRHIHSECPVEDSDLPDTDYEITTAELGAGAQHHIEIMARLVQRVGVPEAATGS